MAAHPITLDPDLQARLERVARREVRSPEFVVRDALEMYFAASGKTDDDNAAIAEHNEMWDAGAEPTINREQFLQEARDSMEHYRHTGLHLTNEEVGNWIERLRNDPSAKLPECHT